MNPSRVDQGSGVWAGCLSGSGVWASGMALPAASGFREQRAELVRVCVCAGRVFAQSQFLSLVMGVLASSVMALVPGRNPRTLRARSVQAAVSLNAASEVMVHR